MTPAVTAAAEVAGSGSEDGGMVSKLKPEDAAAGGEYVGGDDKEAEAEADAADDAAAWEPVVVRCICDCLYVMIC